LLPTVCDKLRLPLVHQFHLSPTEIDPRQLRPEEHLSMHTHSKTSAPTLPPEIEKYLEETYPSDLPAAVVAILRHGEVIHKSAYGLADMHRGIPMSVDYVHRISSLSKQFTAAANMLLNERHPERSDGRGHRLVDVLQPPPAALDTGLHKPDEV
jgi:CubicO group peptidase (beta-lactamase class C family)